ncbi:hypothetical protein ASPCADRAFT_205562 [Aspergillus carbonarius ITEM 5010]|uniref:Phosphatidate cytidylyltransferase, mitochondrial n=1 Tax=Aspergillus carbonarius (strain ITEM 5010) TaxID=602072 RepID=A0A1R3RV39_ASPC5|nr:hypothetical protein ASPCADRAFT_205562 [Aspergillus carbonarius ITEM 5010]
MLRTLHKPLRPLVFSWDQSHSSSPKPTLQNILSQFPTPIDYAIAYGSNIFPQSQSQSHSPTQTDLIISVPNIHDLLHWETMHLAGRFHKPVLVLKEIVEGAVVETVRWPSLVQSLKSILTAGMGKSWRHAMDKMRKARGGR